MSELREKGRKEVGEKEGEKVNRGKFDIYINNKISYTQ